MDKHDVIHKTVSITYCIVVRRGPSPHGHS